MTSAVYDRTPNLGLGLIEFNFPNWADDANLNMQILDAALAAVGVAIKGTWQNNTIYNVGDLVIDPDTSRPWRANITHTSAATGTFEEDRIAHPTYWIDASLILHARGQWTPATTYYPNDVVYDGYLWALATQQHTSSSSLNTDISDGKFVVITDSTTAVEDSEAAATVAMDSATSASASATTATTSANNANAAATAASSSEASAASSATDAQSSEDDAELAATRAEAALAAMLPDAASDGQYYARRNASWQAVIGEAPQDGLVYARKSGNWVIATGAMIVADSPPSPVANGQLWFESDSGQTFMWYSDPNSSQWIHISGFSTLGTGTGGGIAEAPADGHTYARRDTAWVDMGGAVPVNEAPADGKSYVRKNNAWVELVLPTPPTIPMVFDTNGDAVVKFGASIVVRIKPSGLILTKDDLEVFSVSV
jgi:hypothetical protein